MTEPAKIPRRSTYKRIGLVLLFIIIAIGVGVGAYSAWYHFSGQRSKIKYSQFESEVRRIESNARVGYHFRSDP